MTFYLLSHNYLILFTKKQVSGPVWSMYIRRHVRNIGKLTSSLPVAPPVHPLLKLSVLRPGSQRLFPRLPSYPAPQPG